MSLSRDTFANRSEAGRRLATEIASRGYPNPVVLALPRGGVPVGFEVAKAIGAPLDLIMVRKLGAPGHQEYAIGAVVDGEQPQLVIDKQAARLAGASDAYVEDTKARALAEIERRRALYSAESPATLSGKTAILVDDGIATGNTVRAALKALRLAKPARIVLAVPLAPSDTLADIAHLCDDVICLLIPRPFYAVGAHYDDFGQTSDAEVVTLLSEARKFHASAAN